MGSDAYIRGGIFFIFYFEAVLTCHKFGENLEPIIKAKNQVSRKYTMSVLKEAHSNHIRKAAIGKKIQISHAEKLSKNYQNLYLDNFKTFIFHELYLSNHTS